MTTPLPDPPVAYPLGTWEVRAVDACTGASPATLAGVAIDGVTWTLNDVETADLTIRTVDAGLAEFLDPTREIQILRNGTVIFWGPTVRPEIDANQGRMQCAGSWWYLTRRFFGKADRTNELLNGDFESGLADWSTSGAVVAGADPTRSVQGGSSARLTGTSLGHDTYLHQTYTHHQSHPLGDLLTIAAWIWVSSADYVGDAFDSLALYAERRASDGTFITSALAQLEPGDRDTWVRKEITLELVKEGDTVDVRLYPPYGTAWFDLVTLTGMESLAFDEQDMATIIRGIVLYAQDRYPGFTHGKTDLNIDVTAAPTGVTLSRAYQFADHQSVSESLNEFVNRRGGVDYAVEVTDTTRTLVVSHPHRGFTHTDLTLTYPGNVIDFRWSLDRTQEATSTVVLGPGDGPDREEGGASTTADGPELEDVTTAPDGTLPGELAPMAAERLAVVTHPDILEVTCVGVLDVLHVGDWVPVAIACGAVAIDDTYRAVTITATPANDSAVVTLNLRDPETPEEAMARFPRAVDACLAPGGGVWVVGSDGGVGSYGGAAFHGSAADIVLNAPMVAIVPHGAGGYWLVGADTGVFAYGDAPTRYPYSGMIDTEYARGDRAIVAAEAYDPGGADTLIMIADDGDTYIASSTP